jgi:hypothetical protein
MPNPDKVEAKESNSSTKTLFHTSSKFREVLEPLENAGYVDSGTTLAKVAISYALKLNLEINPSRKLSDKDGITLALSQFDPVGSLAALIRQIQFVDDKPTQKEIFEEAELLCESGIIKIGDLLRTGMTIIQIITAND